jgi:hypothetical protein
MKDEVRSSLRRANIYARSVAPAQAKRKSKRRFAAPGP